MISYVSQNRRQGKARKAGKKKKKLKPFRTVVGEFVLCPHCSAANLPERRRCFNCKEPLG